jgi:hypothetical protein
MLPAVKLEENTMKNLYDDDEIMAELRQSKDKIARECGYDIDRLFDRLKKHEKALPAGRISKRRPVKPFSAPALAARPAPLAACDPPR